MPSRSSLFAGMWRLMDTNPVVFGSWVLGGIAVSLPFVVVPIRAALGMPTNQFTKISAPRKY